jgi:hypothetical protein
VNALEEEVAALRRLLAELDGRGCAAARPFVREPNRPALIGSRNEPRSVGVAAELRPPKPAPRH